SGPELARLVADSELAGAGDEHAELLVLVLVFRDDAQRLELDQTQGEPLAVNHPARDSLPDPLGLELAGVLERAQGRDRTALGDAALDLYAIGLRERLLRVGERRVREALVAPPRAPAVADDEAVGRVADEGGRVPSASRVGVVGVEVPACEARVVPRRV